MSYRLLLGCGGQTKCYQIANQLIQISLHQAKSLLIPLKIPSELPNRSTCSCVCVCVCCQRGQRKVILHVDRQWLSFNGPSLCLRPPLHFAVPSVRSYLPSSPFLSPLSSPGSSAISAGPRGGLEVRFGPLIKKTSVGPSLRWPFTLLSCTDAALCLTLEMKESKTFQKSFDPFIL